MSSNENKEPGETFTDKLRAILGLNASPKTKNGLPPRARFSIWYFLIAMLFFSYLQPLLFSTKVETIPYSQFKQYIAEGKVGKLTIGPDNMGLVSYERPRQSMFLPEGFSPGKNYSEAMATQIDEEVTRIIEEAHQRVRKILSARRTVLDDLAHLLSHEESVQGDELRKMLSAAAPAMAAPPSGEPSRGTAQKEDDESGI